MYYWASSAGWGYAGVNYAVRLWIGRQIHITAYCGALLGVWYFFKGRAIEAYYMIHNTSVT